MNEHPWTGLRSTKERKAAKAAMKAWLKANPDKRRKRGDQRADGLVFYAYCDGSIDGETWITPQARDAYLKKHHEFYERAAKDPIKSKEIRDVKRRWEKQYYAKKTKERDFRKKANALAAGFRARHPSYSQPYSVRRRAMKNGAVHPHLDTAFEKALYREAKRLTQETGIEFQVDHIIPLAHGGVHHHENLQLLPWWVNKSKHKDPFWRSKDMAFRDWRDVPAELWPDGLRNEYSKQMRREPDYLLTG